MQSRLSQLPLPAPLRPSPPSVTRPPLSQPCTAGTDDTWQAASQCARDVKRRHDDLKQVLAELAMQTWKRTRGWL